MRGVRSVLNARFSQRPISPVRVPLVGDFPHRPVSARNVRGARAVVSRAIAKHDPATAEGLLDVERACAYLARSKDVDEIKKLHDVAAAAALYRRSRGAALDSQNHAAEIQLRCERRLGELSLEIPKGAKGRPPKKSGNVAGFSKERAVKDTIGVEPREARRFEKIATIPQPAFERHVAEVKEKQQRITTSGALKVALKEAARFTPAKPAQKAKPKPEPEWIPELELEKVERVLSDASDSWRGKTFGTLIGVLKKWVRNLEERDAQR